MGPSAQSRGDPEHPDSIGRYVIDGVLGHGAMGVVYRGHDPVIDRPVAIKTVRTELLSGPAEEEVIARFEREARTAGRFVHPNVVAVFDFDGRHEPPYLAMELVNGRALSDLQREGHSFDLPRIRSIMVQLLSALECAHDHGIVHRDIKPSNLLMEPDNRVKITDFGVARFATPDTTQFGSMVGTPRYMAPEQFLGQVEDRRTDIFSAGVLLYELVTNKRPFFGGSATEILSRIMNQPLPDPLEVVPSLPRRLSEVLQRALAPDPDKRFPSAAAFRDALESTIGCGPAAPRASESETTLAATRFAPPMPDAAPVAVDDPEVVRQIEKDLARIMGPIASVMVKRAVKRASDLDGLYETLAQEIPNPRDASDFKARGARMRERLARGEGPSSSGERLRSQSRTGGSQDTDAALARFDAHALDRATRALAQHFGPIASVMVRKAAKRAGSLAELYDQLASQIQDDAARRAFLDKAPRR